MKNEEVKTMLSNEELGYVNGGEEDLSRRVSISEPTQGDPRCGKCNSHLNYTHTYNNYHYFTCSSCGKVYFKNLCGVWFEK